VACLLTTFAGGCASLKSLPLADSPKVDVEPLQSGPFIIHCDFDAVTQREALKELARVRGRLENMFALPPSRRVLHVYIDRNELEYLQRLREINPALPDRRACFVGDENLLGIYAYTGTHLGEDLRHEGVHGYLHEVAPHLPLWLDEGVAEWCESLPTKGRHEEFIQELREAHQNHEWQPNLARLESITDPRDLTARDYAEAWLWCDFLYSHDAGRQLLTQYLATARVQPPGTLLPTLRAGSPSIEADLVRHLEQR